MGQSLVEPNSFYTEHLACAHYEAARLNTELLQWLLLSPAGLDNLAMNIDKHRLDDVIKSLLRTNESYLNHKNIIIEVSQSADLVCQLNKDSIGILLRDVLINAIRYSQKKR